jgi:hypothetical protein
LFLLTPVSLFDHSHAIGSSDTQMKGIGPTANYLSDDVDGNGDPVEPNQKTMNVNLTACMNTVTLGIYYMKKQETGGAIVMTASGSSKSSRSARVVRYIYYINMLQVMGGSRLQTTVSIFPCFPLATLVGNGIEISATSNLQTWRPR